MRLLAQTSIADYGLLGIAVTALTSAVTWLAKGQIKRESERGDALQVELREVQTQFAALVEKTITALAESSLTLRDASRLIQRQQDLLERRDK